MAGGLYTEGVEVNGLQVGLAMGGYEQQARPYSDLGINTFRLVAVDGVDFVPILGLALNYKVELKDGVYIKLNNLIEPILTNTTLSLGYNF